MWVETLRLTDVRNIRSLELELGPGLNVFVGENAQRKTTLLEAVGLIARGRSFRSADSRSMIRRGSVGLRAVASARDTGERAQLAVELDGDGRRFHVNGRPAVALLDDLDSELDAARGRAVCARFGERGQALVTTAHPAFSGALPAGARVFKVAAGEVRAACDATGRA